MRAAAGNFGRDGTGIRSKNTIVSSWKPYLQQYCRQEKWCHPFFGARDDFGGEIATELVFCCSSTCTSTSSFPDKGCVACASFLKKQQNWLSGLVERNSGPEFCTQKTEIITVAQSEMYLATRGTRFNVESRKRGHAVMMSLAKPMEGRRMSRF